MPAVRFPALPSLPRRRAALASSSRFGAAAPLEWPPGWCEVEETSQVPSGRRARPMSARMRFAMAVLAIATATRAASAQTPPDKLAEAPPRPAPTVIAATVNGQDIPELAVYRGLLSKHPMLWKVARKEILDYLIDTMLVDQ